MSESHDTHSPAASHGDAHASGEHAASHARLYLIIGGILLVFTGITVFLSYVDFNKWLGSGRNWNIIIAMIVAGFKSSLVAAVFMHLLGEKWTIYRFLILAVFFVIGLFALSILAFHDPIRLNF